MFIVKESTSTAAENSLRRVLLDDSTVEIEARFPT